MPAKLNLYKAEISTPLGIYTFVVESTKDNAKGDLLTAAQSDIKCPFGMLRVKEVYKTTKKIMPSCLPIKSCKSNDVFWAWVVKR